MIPIWYCKGGLGTLNIPNVLEVLLNKISTLSGRLHGRSSRHVGVPELVIAGVSKVQRTGVPSAPTSFSGLKNATTQPQTAPQNGK